MDQDRGRDFRRKKYPPYKDKEEKPMKRPIILMKSKDDRNSGKQEDPPPQTILLKTRDGDSRAVSPQTSNVRPSRDSEGGPAYQIASRSKQPEVASPLAGPPVMKEAVKFLEDNSLQIQDNILEFLTDTSDFLVVGCLGLQGVGKSTVMSHLASPPSDIPEAPGVFKPQSRINIDSSTHGTQGIDIYVTPQRMILLDTQPLLSLSVMSKYYSNESGATLAARSCSRDDPDYPCIENDIELLSLQYASFLLSVCHVVLLTQDYIHNPEISRFLQVAEKLKPTTGTHTEDDSSLGYYPRIVFLHTKTKSDYFTKQRLREIQETYKTIFAQSHLVIQSGIGIANGSVLKSLSPTLCGCEALNVFLLPPFKTRDEAPMYELASYSFLMKSLRQQIIGLPRTQLTNGALTEKTWFYYASKIWDTVKKSPLFPEYGRLLKTGPPPLPVPQDINDCPVS